MSVLAMWTLGGFGLLGFLLILPVYVGYFKYIIHRWSQKAYMANLKDKKNKYASY